MGHIEKTVFISYRRDDVPWALAVYQHLAAHGYDVFFDYNSIHSGDFEQIIVGNIRARAHFVLILTPSALDRCHEPGDWLRREIEAALREKRNIIPLFFDGFSFGNPAVSSKLTGDLTALRRYNGFNVHNDYFDAAMEKLREQFLTVELDAVLHPLSQEAQREVQAQKEAADKALQEGEQTKEGKRKEEKKEEDELFELGIRAELMGELEQALNYYYRVRKIDPLYPRIERKIEDLENELRRVARPPAPSAPPRAPQRNPLLRLAVLGIVAAVGVCGLSLSYLGVRAVIAPGPAMATQDIATSAVVLPPTVTLVAEPESPEITFGPWLGQTSRLEISVDRVEVIDRVGDQKILRFYLSVNNQSGDALTLPLFNNFLVIDSAGGSYTADHQLSDWPRTFPAGQTVTGSIDMEDPVPEGVSSMSIHFSTIFGGLEFVGESLTVADISVP